MTTSAKLNDAATIHRTKKRVVQCYSGGVGQEVVRRIINHPAMELVGLLVHSPDKAGRDIGDIVGTDRLGINATDKLDDVIALAPDGVIWSAQGYHPESIARLLESGIDVYTGLGGYFLEGEADRPLIEGAALRGGASFAAGGNIPGLISDVLPIFLSGFSGGVRSIRAVQRNHVADYPSPSQLSEGLGIGKPKVEGSEPNALDMGWEWLITMSAKMVAAALGIEFTSLTTIAKDIVLAPRTVTLPGSGLVVPEGSVGGVRWTWEARSGDRPFLTVVNEQTALYDLGPGWRADDKEPAWTVEVDGDPPIVATIGWPEGGSPAASNSHLNAARAINVLEVLMDAPPGLHSVLDLPMIACSDAMGRAQYD